MLLRSWRPVPIPPLDAGLSSDMARDLHDVLGSLVRICWRLVRHYAVMILSVFIIAGLAWLLGFSISGVLHGRVR